MASLRETLEPKKCCCLKSTTVWGMAWPWARCDLSSTFTVTGLQYIHLKSDKVGLLEKSVIHLKVDRPEGNDRKVKGENE